MSTESSDPDVVDVCLRADHHLLHCLIENDLVINPKLPLRARLKIQTTASANESETKPETKYLLSAGLERIAERFSFDPSSVFFEDPENPDSVLSAKDLKPERYYLIRGNPVARPDDNPIPSPIYKVGLLSDERMLLHADCKSPVAEKPVRYTSILDAVDSTPSLFQSVVRISETREATIRELRLCHRLSYIRRVERGAIGRRGADYYFNGEDRATTVAAKVSVGTVLVAIEKVLELEEFDSCFCVNRPPGHHALQHKQMGFCFFSNVSIGAKWIRKKHPSSRVLIVDWDVHHGNGTQDCRMDDPRILFVSLHRDFYPGTGDSDNIGDKGNTVNVLFRHAYNDAALIQAFYSVVMPISFEFAPDFVLVSAGFDAVVSDPLGECQVHPRTYGYLTQLLMQLTGGRNIVLALEGGYNPVQLKACAASCIYALAGHRMSPPMMDVGPSERRAVSPSAMADIAEVQRHQAPFWNCMKIYEEAAAPKIVRPDPALEFPSDPPVSPSQTPAAVEPPEL